jgi:hypothetical protein
MNAINVIAPYQYEGLWVFDDERVGLVQEPFVGGADTILDQMVREIPNAGAGFTLIFSAADFPGSRYRLEWRRPDRSGNVYFSADLGMEGWLCPALLRYFEEPPAEIFVQVKARTLEKSA